MVSLAVPDEWGRAIGAVKISVAYLIPLGTRGVAIQYKKGIVG